MLIQTENLTKIYKLGEVEVPALKSINLRVGDGEFISIIGPSGSGKSTLLNLLGCLDTPTTGIYFLDGVKIGLGVNLARIRRQKIGFVFQTFNLLPRLTALENVEVPMIYGGVSSSERRGRAKKLLQSVGLGERINHRPNELSGGERQRVAIARALSNNPPLILADEPTGNLDSKSGGEILKILTDLNRQGTTLIMVTHEDYLAQKADRVVKLFDGEVVDGKNVTGLG